MALLETETMGYKYGSHIQESQILIHVDIPCHAVSQVVDTSTGEDISLMLMHIEMLESLLLLLSSSLVLSVGVVGINVGVVVHDNDVVNAVVVVVVGAVSILVVLLFETLLF